MKNLEMMKNHLESVTKVLNKLGMNDHELKHRPWNQDEIIKELIDAKIIDKGEVQKYVEEKDGQSLGKLMKTGMKIFIKCSNQDSAFGNNCYFTRSAMHELVTHRLYHEVLQGAIDKITKMSLSDISKVGNPKLEDVEHLDDDFLGNSIENLENHFAKLIEDES